MCVNFSEKLLSGNRQPVETVQTSERPRPTSETVEALFLPQRDSILGKTFHHQKATLHNATPICRNCAGTALHPKTWVAFGVSPTGLRFILIVD